MDDKLIEFTHLLRQNGLKVSVAENMDTFAALGLTGIGDRQILKDTLRATLVKRVVDIPVYDELFDLYFTGLGELIKAASASTLNALELSEEEFQRFLEQLEEALAAGAEVVADLVGGHPAGRAGKAEGVVGGVRKALGAGG